MAEWREFHPPHVYEQNACYFVTAGTVGRQRLLDTAPRRALLRDILRGAVRDYAITLHAWVILANHYHLLLQTGSTIPVWKFIKRLHGESAIRLNELDGTPGRKVWYQYWDHSPRGQSGFWSCFNYVHINPLKHGYVRACTEALLLQGGQFRIASGRYPEVHEALAHYPFSSYHAYMREYGEAFMTSTWTHYPIPERFAHDDP
jgi:putative transposase